MLLYYSTALAQAACFWPSLRISTPIFRGSGARQCGEANLNPHLAFAELYAEPHGHYNPGKLILLGLAGI